MHSNRSTDIKRKYKEAIQKRDFISKRKPILRKHIRKMLGHVIESERKDGNIYEAVINTPKGRRRLRNPSKARLIDDVATIMGYNVIRRIKKVK